MSLGFVSLWLGGGLAVSCPSVACSSGWAVDCFYGLAVACFYGLAVACFYGLAVFTFAFGFTFDFALAFAFLRLMFGVNAVIFSLSYIPPRGPCGTDI